MSDLTREKCEACRSDAPRVEGEELKALIKEISDRKIEVVQETEE